MLQRPLPRPHGCNSTKPRHIRDASHTRQSMPRKAGPYVETRPKGRQDAEPFRWRLKVSPVRWGQPPFYLLGTEPRSAGWMTSPVAHLGPPLLTKFKEGDRMGPNGCRMPKRLKFFSTLTRWNCEPYKHAAIFLKKNHFLLYILSSGCLYVVENAITPQVRRKGRPRKTST